MAIPALNSKRIHTGKVVNLDVDTVRYPDGSTGQLEMIRHPGAAAVVPFASDPRGPDPTILLIRQYRYAAGGPLFEIPAGRLNPGEDPRVCAERELLEEVGVKAGRVERLTTIWTTPGFTDERIHLFWATELRADKHAREPDEFIEVTPKPLSEVVSLIQSGEICDAKTALAILFVAGFTLEH
jgi:ADP-ribose pyrophosphatase